MKEHIKAGFGIVIGMALANTLIGIINDAIDCVANKKKTKETESEENGENE